MGLIKKYRMKTTNADTNVYPKEIINCRTDLNGDIPKGMRSSKKRCINNPMNRIVNTIAFFEYRSL
jgi:hypothetical protein